MPKRKSSGGESAKASKANRKDGVDSVVLQKYPHIAKICEWFLG